MIQRPSPKDIWRIDFGKFIVLLILSMVLIALLVWHEMALTPLV